MQGVAALRRQSPQSGRQVLGASSLQKICVGNSHHIRETPGEVVRLDEMVTRDRVHIPRLNHLPVKVKSSVQKLSTREV